MYSVKMAVVWKHSGRGVLHFAALMICRSVALLF